jgi:glyoxylase-like metal-dependent hydrolase (beta-lactamase superfamily II)
MITIKRLEFNPFRENTYVISDDTGECVIVDPGCHEPEEQDLLQVLFKDNDLKPVKIVNTHCHIDHILGVAFLHDQYKLPFLIHPQEKPLLKASIAQGEFFGLEVQIPPEPSGFLNEGDKVTFGDSILEVIHIPGHSPGGIVLLNRDQQCLFSGDVLFQGSIGRTDLPGGDYDSLVNSIRQKLLILDPEIRVFPGHGPDTTIGIEKQSNPFFHRCQNFR